MPIVKTRLHASRGLLEEVYQEAPIGLCLLDHELRFVFVNKWLADLNGIDINQHLGRKITEVVPAVAGAAEQQLRGVLETGVAVIEGVIEVESPLEEHGKSIFQHNYQPVWEGDTVVGVSCVVQDITKEKLSERLVLEVEERNLIARKLLDGEKLFRILLEASPDAMVFSDTDGLIVIINAQTEELFGYRSEELIGKSVEILIPERYEKSHVGHRHGYLQTPSTRSTRSMGLGGTLVARRKDGSEVPVEISLSTMEISGSSIVTSTIRDITARLEIETEARKSHADLAHAMRLNTAGEMASGIAHELNQPLSAITAYANALKNIIGHTEPDAKKLVSIIDKIVSQAMRSGEIIKKMREFVSHEKPNIASFNLALLFADVHLFLESDLLAGQTKLEVSNIDFDAEIMADSIQIQQVLVNLIRNSIDAMQHLQFTDRVVTLSTETQGDKILVCIEDRGEAVPESELEKIFSAFNSSKTGGMGMGLAISRSIIENHGGYLFATLNEGEGMSFQFSLSLRG